MLGEQRLGDFRAEVAEVNDKRVAAGVLDILERLNHVDLALDDADRTFIDFRGAVLFRVGLHQRLSAVDGKGLREAVAADRDDADLDLRDVVHVKFLLETL